MAWIKVTRFTTGEPYCINTDKLISFGWSPGAQFTNLWETGAEDEEPRRVRETPDELLALIRDDKPSSPGTATLSLTKEQIDFLSDTLWIYEDKGPQGSGWASIKLQELRNIVAKAQEELK